MSGLDIGFFVAAAPVLQPVENETPMGRAGSAAWDTEPGKILLTKEMYHASP